MSNPLAMNKDGGKRRNRVKLVIVAAAFIAGLTVATQYFAHICAYSPTLGPNVGNAYFPGMLAYWYAQWGSQFPEQFRKAIGLGGFTTAAILLIYIIVDRISRQTARGNLTLHGTAHWATENEIRQAGILGNDEGVYVGAWTDQKGRTHYLRDNGPSHVLCFAPTRSGKGVGLVLPTLLSWTHSCVISDLKGELWALTSGWRKKYANNRVLRFEPASPAGCARWNPLDEIRVGTEYESGDIAGMANIIIDPLGKGLEDFWTKSALDLLIACITHLVYKRERGQSPANMKTLCYMLANPGQTQAELFQEMTSFGHYEDGTVHEGVASQGAAMLNKPENERGSVVSTMQSCLGLYRDPVVARNTETCDFKIRDLMHFEDPVSLYMITTPDVKARLTPLMRLMLTFMIQTHAAKMDFDNGRPVPKYKHRLLMMLDEFPSFGNMPMLSEAPSYVAGYGLKIYYITQDTVQLAEKYGDKNSIISNCHIKVAFPPNRLETAKYLSELLGKKTVLDEHISESGKRAGMLLGNVSRTVQATGASLMTPDQVMTMQGPEKDLSSGDIVKAGEMIVSVAGFAPILGKQPLYFKDETFLARAKVRPPETTDKTILDTPKTEKISI